VRSVDWVALLPQEVVAFGPFRLFVTERLLRKRDETLPLGGRALDILITLVERAGEVVTQKELISRVWPDVTVEEANLRVQVTGLRKALGDGHKDARCVVNVPGRGYCFVAPVTRSTARQTSSPVETAAPHSPNNLPARLTRMVGRDGAVVALSGQLITCRFVSVVGPGGIGKTTVAVSVAHMLADGFNGAVFFVDLAALTDPQLVPAAVGSALGFMVQTRDPLASLLAFIDDRKILLVLDSCEHVIDVAAPLAERLVSETPHAHVLTTSREVLRVEGEHVHWLFALDCPPEDTGLTATEALKYPAAQLFMERAAASGYGAALSDIDAPIVARICRRLDGIALAIELVASRVGSLGIDGTAEVLEKRFGLVWDGRRTSLARHRTLNAMLDWSYCLLSEHEKAVLCRLSVFVGGFTLQAACFVTTEIEADDGGVIDAVASLVAKSLISTMVTDGPTYYRLLDVTRAYAATKLAERGEADHVARRHAINYSEFLERDELIQSKFGEHDLSGYAPHIGNVRAALEWALSEHGDAAVGVGLATWAAPLFIGLSLLDECKCWCERALDALDSASRGTSQEMILQEALALSLMFTSGHNDQVRTAVERGLALAEALEDPLHQTQLLAGLNNLLPRLGDFRGAAALAEKSCIIAQRAQNMADLSMAEWVLGKFLQMLGDQAAAQLHCERRMTCSVELPGFNANLFGFDYRVFGLLGLARALWLRGFSNQALKTAQRAIDEATSHNHAVSICSSLTYGLPVFLWAGDFGKTADLIERLIVHSKRYSLEPYRAQGLALKGELAICRNEPETGVELLRSALEALDAVQHKGMTMVFLGALAEGLRKTLQVREAFLTITGAIARAENFGGTFYLAELLRIKAQILAAMPGQDRSLAMDCLNEALTVAHEQSALALELRSATTLAQLLAESGQREQARYVLTLVYDRFTEGFETMDLRIARQTLEDLA
jgi:predicted ATPase/DNA-binding winged helix-turn-helix (wHTH) protein